MTGREILSAIERGCLDPEIRGIAAGYYASAAATALGNDHSRKPGTIRASDAGRCVRELWADLHGKLDLPQDASTQLSRFDIGTLYGAWLAAILKATLEKEDANIRVVLEVEVTRQGVTGHADAIVCRCLPALLNPQPEDFKPIYTCEFKSTYGKSNKKLPSEDRFYQVAQVTHYALTYKSPMGGVITFAPAAWPAEDRFTAEDCDPAVYELRTDLEYARLAAALLDEMPDGDPDQAWRCQSCRFSACERNKNAAANMLELS